MIKMDMPPNPEGATPTATATAAMDNSNKLAVSKPTHVEVAADSAVVTRANNTLVFAGNVKGFYELTARGAETEHYNFTGERAEFTFVTEEVEKRDGIEPGLHSKITAKPMEGFIALPPFDAKSINKK
jgi:hypothetical protein